MISASVRRRLYKGFMQIQELIQRSFRRARLLPGPIGFFRKLLLRFMGAQIGAGTTVPRCLMPWPHQVKIGKGCTFEPDIHFKFDGYWLPGPNILIGNRVFIGRAVELNIQGKIEIGDDTGIGSGCILTDHNHGTAPTDICMRDQPVEIAPIRIGRDVVVGVNTVILKGVQIGDGAVVGAGSVVAKSIPAGEIWIGNPARKIRDRGAAEDIREFRLHSG
jgi:acetyltransferase-like isoleucine patch superfamily enzyme